MVPRVRPNGLKFSVYRVPCCRAVLRAAAFHVAAQFSLLPRPMAPRSSLCCRVPWCRAGGQMVSVLCVAASHGAAHSRTAALHSAAHLYVAAFHGAARAAKWSQFSVLPRPMVPRGRPNGLSSLCCRGSWCRAVLHVAAFYAAAPRSLVPRSLRVAALPRAARGTTHRVFALLPRGGLDCYKRAARSTVGVSCSTAVVEVGRLRINVEVSRSAALMKYGCATVVVEKRCCIFDVGVKFDNRRSGYTRSSNQRSYLTVVWDWRHSVTFGRTGCA